jgi:DNA-binding beta-propeller fold protein YncE
VAAPAAGCEAATPAKTTKVAAPDLLLAAVPGGRVIVRGGDVQALGDAIATPDGRRVIRAFEVGADTNLVTMSAATGQVVAATKLVGRWAPRVTSGDGGYVALTSPDRGGTTGYAPSAQERSRIAVICPGAPVEYLELPGNYVPDAFSASGSIYALDWLPATKPDYYRVREIELATRQPTPLLTRNKVPIPPGDEEQMRGEGRLAAFGPDLTVLYTLYTHQPGHEHTRDLISGQQHEVHAFVHTLQLDQHWAYCVDLPDPFGSGPTAGHTVATAPDGAVFVADLTSGRLAAIDPVALTIKSVTDIPTGTGVASAAATRAYVFVGAGPVVHVIGRDDLAVTATWQVGGAVQGLAVNADGSRLYVGLPGEVAWLDAGTGARQGSLAVPGLTGLVRRL